MCKLALVFMLANAKSTDLLLLSTDGCFMSLELALPQLHSLRMLNCLFSQNPGARKPIGFAFICHLENLAFSSKVHISSTCACQHVVTLRLFWVLKAVKKLVSYYKKVKDQSTIDWLIPGAQLFMAYVVSCLTKISYQICLYEVLLNLVL